MSGVQVGRLALGLALLALSLLIPGDLIAAKMIGSSPSAAHFGLTIFRICLALEGLLVALWAVLPSDWLRGPGLPAFGPPRSEDGGAVPPNWAALGVIVTVGAALRLIGLARNLWVDEIATVIGYLRLPPWRTLYTYHSPNQHLLYSFLGSVSLRMFGESEWSARLPAALFGVAGLVALYYLARAITSEREALLATAFLALSYHHVWFSQDARGYTSMLFWSTLAMGLFVRALRWNRPRLWVGYVVSTVLAIASVQVAANMFLGQVAGYFLTSGSLGRGNGDRRALTRCMVGSALLTVLLAVHVHSLVLPMIISFFATAPRAGMGSGITTPLEFLGLFREGLRAGFAGIGVLGVLLLMAAGWLAYWRQSALLASVLVLPPAFGMAEIVILHYGAYPRAFLYVLPLAALMAVRGAMEVGGWAAQRAPAGRWRQLARAHLGVGLATAMLAVSAAALPLNYRYPKQDYTGALAFVDQHKGPADRISAAGMAAAVYRSYYAPGLDFPATPADLGALRGQDHAVWVLYSFPRDMRLRFPALYDYIRLHARIVTTFRGTVGDGTIYVTRLDGA
jgi:mannosyltransferase